MRIETLKYLCFFGVGVGLGSINIDHKPALPSPTAPAEVNKAWREGVTYGAQQVVTRGCTLKMQFHPSHIMKELNYDRPDQ